MQPEHRPGCGGLSASLESQLPGFPIFKERSPASDHVSPKEPAGASPLPGGSFRSLDGPAGPPAAPGARGWAVAERTLWDRAPQQHRTHTGAGPASRPRAPKLGGLPHPLRPQGNPIPVPLPGIKLNIGRKLTLRCFYPTVFLS